MCSRQRTQKDGDAFCICIDLTAPYLLQDNKKMNTVVQTMRQKPGRGFNQSTLAHAHTHTQIQEKKESKQVQNGTVEKKKQSVHTINPDITPSLHYPKPKPCSRLMSLWLRREGRPLMSTWGPLWANTGSQGTQAASPPRPRKGGRKRRKKGGERGKGKRKEKEKKISLLFF